MTDIFFSYSREDKDRVAFIAAALEAEGYDLWWDTDIAPGETYRGVTQAKLRAAKCVIVVWSETSVHSRWVIGEAEEGLERDILLPIIIDDVVRDIPLDFRSVQVANLTRWKGDLNNHEWKKVLASVKRLVEEPAKPPQRYRKPKRPGGGGRAMTALALFFGVIAAGIGFLYWSSIRGGGPADVATREATAEPDASTSQPSAEPAKEAADESRSPAETEPAPSEPPFTVMAMSGTRYTTGEANVRAGPGTEYDVVARLAEGEAVTLTGKVDGENWYRIRTAGGTEAYISGNLLTDQPPSTGPKIGQRFRDCADCPEMVVVPAGSFQMGDLNGGGDPDEKPVHPVTIAKPFAVGVFEVTFAEWDACVAAGGCGGYRLADQEDWGRGRRPAINVNWEDAQGFVAWLSLKTGKNYRLLSEAEWEYAARAGSTTKYSFGDSESALCRYANGADLSTDHARRNTSCSDGFGKQTAPAGSFQPNDFRLYDMHGNVYEWVQDCWNASYTGAPSTGRAWESGDCSRRVLRGGSWVDKPRFLRSANRNGDPSLVRFSSNGFRISRTLD